MNMEYQEEYFKSINDRLFVNQQDIKKLTENVSKLREEIRVLEVGILKDHEIQIKKIQEDLENPKAFRMSIATKVITAILIALVMGLLTWMGENLHNSENISQQKIINKLIKTIKKS